MKKYRPRARRLFFAFMGDSDSLDLSKPAFCVHDLAVERFIESFEQDDEQHWVAVLSCGHRQHVRHQPPMIMRPWVQSPQGRAEKIGAGLNCLYCDMPLLPETASPYKETPVFDETTVPAGLLRDHSTKRGVWGQIQVMEGIVLYVIEDEETLPSEVRAGSWHLRPGICGIVPPEVKHRVALQPGARFRVVFFRHQDEQSLGQ